MDLQNNESEQKLEDGSRITVESKPETDGQQTDETQENSQAQRGNQSMHAINDLTSPLLAKDAQIEAFYYGYSFNSKRMAMGPAFFNIRIICDCLGRAIRRHIDFSQGRSFLDELNEAKKERKVLKKQMAEITNKKDPSLEDSGCSNVTAFSYQFKDELKITTTK